MKAPLIHIASTVFDSPLAIIPEKLETILRAIGPRMEVDQTALDALFADRVIRAKESGMPSLSFQNFRAYWDDDDEGSGGANGKPYKIAGDGIAIINISGTLVKKGGWMSSFSGCSSYDGVTKAVKAAMDDGLVKGLLFNSSSPGGTTHGCFECADLIYSYRGVKPMFGIANDLAASAAYALLSSCDRIFITRTGCVGSIGVFSLHVDQSGYDEKMGAKFTYIFAGEKKVDGNPHAPISRSAKSDIQTEVDRQYGIFVSTVARNRNASEKKVSDTEAGVLFADASIPLMADAVGTYDDALAELEKKVGKATSTSIRMSSPTPATNSSVASETNSRDNVSAEGEVKEMVDPNAAIVVNTASAADTDAAISTPTPTPTPASAAMPDKKDCPDPDASDPDEEEEEEEEEEENEDCPPSTNPKDKSSSSLKGTTMPVPAASAADATLAPKKLSVEEIGKITDLCVIAGKPELLAGFVTDNTSVADVTKFFRDQRAATSASTDVHNHQNGSTGSSALDTLENQAIAMANSQGITKAKAYQTLLMRNPRLYDNYVSERDQQTLGVKSISQIEGNAYMRSLHARFHENMGGIGAGVAYVPSQTPKLRIAMPTPTAATPGLSA